MWLQEEEEEKKKNKREKTVAHEYLKILDCQRNKGNKVKTDEYVWVKQTISEFSITCFDIISKFFPVRQTRHVCLGSFILLCGNTFWDYETNWIQIVFYLAF